MGRWQPSQQVLPQGLLDAGQIEHLKRQCLFQELAYKHKAAVWWVPDLASLLCMLPRMLHIFTDLVLTTITDQDSQNVDHDTVLCAGRGGSSGAKRQVATSLLWPQAALSWSCPTDTNHRHRIRSVRVA